MEIVATNLAILIGKKNTKIFWFLFSFQLFLSFNIKFEMSRFCSMWSFFVFTDILLTD